MAIYPAKITLDPHTRGDKWLGGLHFGPVEINGEPPENPLVSARLQFRDQRTDALGYELSTTPAVGNGIIVIEDAATWELDAPEQDLPLAVGVWAWDIEITDSAGRVLTPYGGVIKIIKDITHG